jgi:CubicO group peptidase (beta-lactamase class C family)
MISRRRFLSAGLSALAVTAADGLATPSEAVDEWPIASPESQGVSERVLQAVLDAGAQVRNLRGLVVVRNGHLIAERYYGDAARDDLLAIHSITKSVASMLVGIALQQGKIKSLLQTLGDLFPDAVRKSPDAPANAVTLREILTQTSGLGFDRVSYWQALPVQRRTPPVWEYNDAAVAILSPVLHEAVGVPIETFARQALFAPLGIDRFKWQRFGAEEAEAHSGLLLRPRDLAKIAWTMADDGRWRGAQVVPAEWVRESTRLQVPVSWGIEPVTDIGYGYLWFIGKLQGRPVAWGWGYGAQFAMLVPSLGLAVATAAATPRPADLGKQNTDVMDIVARVVACAS